jgi:hypothetical protein
MLRRVDIRSRQRPGPALRQDTRTDTPNITVASDAVYKTRAEAETAIKR